MLYKIYVEKKYHNIPILRLQIYLVILLLVSHHSIFAASTDQVLAKVDITESINRISLPVYAHLQGATDQDYALVIATQSQISLSGHTYEILETIPEDLQDTNYLIGLERVAGAREGAALLFTVLFDDGRNIIVRVTEPGAEQLTQLGFEIEWLSETPIVITRSKRIIQFTEKGIVTDYNREIANMMSLVTETKAYEYTSGLTGETPVTVGGSGYTISSRYTNSGVSIEKATEYIYEFMQNMGLSASYHNWTYGSLSNRNVIGELKGTVSPEEIILVTAHLDCMPSSGTAPGADDNGSGSVAAMIIAELFVSKSFERTIRFVFFTGEEQGLCGSRRYADKVVADGDNIVAVYNMDMIAWDDIDEPTLRIHTRPNSNSGYSEDIELANIFVDVVNAYGFSSALKPIIDSDGVTASDHSSFWNKGIPAVLAIEDDEDDFCDYYHTSNDTLSTLNLTYFTNYIKASLGTTAHLAKIVRKVNINPVIDLLLNSE